MISAAITGFATAFSLILAIGAQNAFVLRQGLLRRHVFALCLFCALSDAILISAGVLGFGWLVTLNPNFPTLMALGGAGFLVVYGAIRLRAALSGQSAISDAPEQTSLASVLATAAALTWLNPHVYLDTLGLIGAVSTGYEVPAQKLAFGIAACFSSFVFFFSLGYGAQLLAPFMRTARAWQVLDLLIALVMWSIALGLILSVF